MSVKDEYIRRLAALEQIEKIAKENNFDNVAFSELRSLYLKIQTVLEIAKKYEKWQLDVSDYGFARNGGEIGYGIGVYIFSHITNYGDIEPEELLNISFPTGAYIFGDDYDAEFFDEFFNELFLVEPKYTDVINHSLYYSVENGKEAYEHYQSTYQKYRELFIERRKQRKIEKLKAELADLEGNN